MISATNFRQQMRGNAGKYPEDADSEGLIVIQVVKPDRTTSEVSAGMTWTI